MKTTAEKIGNVADMTLEELVREWRRQRYQHFMTLKKEGMTLEVIAKKYNVTRQAVGQFLSRMREEEKSRT